MQVAAQVAYAAAHASGIGYFDNYVNQASVAVNDAHTCSALFDTTAETDPIGWANINADCVWLAEHPASKDAALAMTGMKLWPAGKPVGWSEAWASASELLATLDLGYGEWIDWYNRRIEGHKAAFDIPGDSDRTEDKKILARLADATDKDFWDKGATYANTTLQSWIDEARERVAPPKSKPLTDLLPDPQDGRSPVFGTDASGRIAISAHAGADALRTDPQAQVRHDLARRMAQAFGDALRGHNDAGYITGMAEAYLEAMGDRAEDADPSILIFAGDQIREAIAKHRRAGPNDDLQPLPTAADRGATAFLSAHNMYVGSDPYLDDLDRTTRGPDAPLPEANPAEILQIAGGAHDDGIIAETSYNYIIAATAVAPAVYDRANRHSRFVAGLAQNFARYGIELLSAYPDEAAWAAVAAGVGATVMFGPVAVFTGVAVVAGGVAATVAAAYHMARNIIANEDKYRKLLGTSPAGEHNFNRVIRFLKSLPTKSLKDE